MALQQDDPRPAYLQIAEDLRRAIQRGDMKPGSQLPSTTELIEDYGVARMTVRNALRLLRDEGLVVARQGKGVFVRSTYSPGGDTTDAGSMDAVTERLDAISTQLQRLTDRVDEIEKVTRAGRRSGAKS
jgi:DNA-binding GntR family transcriptional regulator